MARRKGEGKEGGGGGGEEIKEEEREREREREKKGCECETLRMLELPASLKTGDAICKLAEPKTRCE